MVAYEKIVSVNSILYCFSTTIKECQFEIKQKLPVRGDAGPVIIHYPELLYLVYQQCGRFLFPCKFVEDRHCSELLLYVSLIHIHHHLNHSNLTLFVDIVILSRYNFSVTKCYTVATRWLCEGLAKSCGHRKTIGKHHVSIVLPSSGVKARCRR